MWYSPLTRPSMELANQVWSPNWADLPKAATTNKIPVHLINIDSQASAAAAAALITDASWVCSVEFIKFVISETDPTIEFINNIIDSKSKVPVVVNIKIKARVKLQSPILFTINAWVAALQAADLSHQYPINKKLVIPINSHYRIPL